MKTPRVEPAAWAPGPDGVPASTTYGDRYRPAGDPSAQARHVFLAGNGLPGRWAGRDLFTVLETGFGLGHNFLATWAAWQADPRRPGRLVYVSIERHPLDAEGLARAWPPTDDDAEAARRDALRAQWPVPTPDLHRLVLADGCVELLLALGDVHDWLPRLELRADALFLDGFAPDRNPAMWDRDVARGLARLSAPDATLATWSTARGVREALGAASFVTERRPGLPPKRNMMVGCRHAASAEAARRVDARRRAALGTPGSPRPATAAPPAPPGAQTDPPRHACIVGAGLAGCAAAIALVRAGWTVELLDAGPGLATGASGNPAGIFHGTVHPDDGPHARWSRAATLEASREYGRLIGRAGVPGSVDGLLRLEREIPQAAMAERLQRLGLPAAHVRALDGEAAWAWAGLRPASAVGGDVVRDKGPTRGPATRAAADPARLRRDDALAAGLHGASGWALAQAGWVSPAAVCEAWRGEAGSAWTFRAGVRVASLEPDDEAWTLRDASGRALARARVVVVACASGSTELLAPHCDAAAWPAGDVRGQVTWIDAALAGRDAPHRPVAGAGYAVTLPDGRLLFGATAQPDDPQPHARAEDDRHNLERLAALGLVDAEAAEQLAPQWLASGRLGHRVGWRWTTVDRLPLVGPVARQASARHVERTPGLHVIGGFGSRGLTWAPLAGALLAARLSDRPWPVERPLADRLDPGRFARARAEARSGEPG